MGKTQFKLLLPDDVVKAVEAAASENLRSKSAEIVFALRAHYGDGKRGIQ